MTIKLSQPDFLRLTQIVQKLPEFANVRDRRRLLIGVFEGAIEFVDVDGDKDEDLIIEGINTNATTDRKSVV